jgi:polyphosphate glucokinase
MSSILGNGPRSKRNVVMNVLVIDVGGTNIKVLATGQKDPRRFPSGPTMTPKEMVSGAKQIAKGWKYDVVSLGYPGLVLLGKPAMEPHNLGRSALVTDGVVVPMELGHVSYGKKTYEDHVGHRGIDRLGKKEWRRHVAYGVCRLIDAVHPDDVVLGGGNATRIKELPSRCRVGENANAFVGGFRLWDKPKSVKGKI